MAIHSLRINDFRNLINIELLPCSGGLNIICGANGSGKTSLLEAIHFLGAGKSFRSANAAALLRQDEEKLSVFAKIQQQNQTHIAIGIERNIQGSTRLRIAEKESSRMAELAAYLPTRVINSQSHQLFESGPAHRRKYLDWGLFYGCEAFISCWRQFERILKQRNAILRDRGSKNELAVWSEELVKQAEVLDQLRRGYVEQLAPIAISLAKELLGLENIRFSYQPGWDPTYQYAEVLSKSYLDDYRAGHTQFGPHRADLDILSGELLVKHFLSRGQQKLLICAMILAQGILLTNQTNRGLIYLVDDLPAELDIESRKRLIALLSRQSNQIFITTIEQDMVCSLIENKQVLTKVFHVEHGSVVEIIGDGVLNQE